MATITDNVIKNVERGIEHTCCDITARRREVLRLMDPPFFKNAEEFRRQF